MTRLRRAGEDLLRSALGFRQLTAVTESRLIGVDNNAYIYNALGERVEESRGGGSSHLEIYWDVFGNPLVTYNRTTEDEIFVAPVNGRNFVKYINSRTDFLHVSNLGSTGLITDNAGNLTQDELYYPWGQVWQNPDETDDVRFGGMQERDAVTGLDPTPARQYNSTMGRWMTPDPLAGDITNPQSLNRYAYALNNPTTRIDPSGLSPITYKRLPPCYGMVCADQYYGGSMYPGFTSADQTTCTIDGVSANCNSAIADLQNGTGSLTGISVSNPGAVVGSAGSILVQLPGTCSSVSFLNTSTSGTCSAGSDELVSLPGAGPSLGLIPGALAPGANGALQAAKGLINRPKPSPAPTPFEQPGTPNPVVGPDDVGNFGLNRIQLEDSRLVRILDLISTYLGFFVRATPVFIPYVDPCSAVPSCRTRQLLGPNQMN